MYSQEKRANAQRRQLRMPGKFFQWIRSSDMTYVNMLIHETALHDFVDKIGTMNNIQFTDVSNCGLWNFTSQLNYDQTLSQRRYVSYIRRCDEMERRIEYFKTQLARYNLEAEVRELFRINEQEGIPIEDYLNTIGADRNVTSEYLLTSLESLLERQENELRQYNEYNVTLTKQYNQKVEQRFVLELTSGFFKESYNKAMTAESSQPQDTYTTLGSDEKRIGRQRKEVRSDLGTLRVS